MSKLLYKAAKNGDINQVKAIIAAGNININYFCSAQAKRVIDIAAESGHIDIVKYLFEQGAQLAVEATQVGYDFLYCICLCADITQRYELLQWLLSEDRYKTLGDNITIEHIKAALKEPYEAIPIAHAGLLPEHYAALVGSKHFNTSKLNKPVISGFFQGITSAYLLSYSKQYELLKQLAAQSNEKLDLNASPICNNHPEQGTTLAWRLASNEQWELLKQLSQNSIAIDLNAAPTHKNDIYIGTTVAWLLAHHKQWQLFEKLTKNLGEQFDLDARPMHGNNRLKGITIT